MLVLLLGSKMLCYVGCWTHTLVGWLASWLAGWLAGWLGSIAHSLFLSLVLANIKSFEDQHQNVEY